MADNTSNLDSLFLAALEITPAEERAAYLDRTCGNDVALRAEVDQMLIAHAKIGSFLEQPPAACDVTHIPCNVSQDRMVALRAGLAAAFDSDQSVVIGNAGHSVLKSLGPSIHVSRVALRESNAEGADPITRPKSPEMPQMNFESRYQLQGEIARGGMGAILKGRDTDLGRDLAIKVLLDQHKDKPEVIQRFVEEAQIGGQLQHPGIAPVYELGQFADKRPFFSMKLVKGETLAKLLALRKDPSDDRGKLLGIYQQICQTMAYAHSRGVIHRDLKPANIMVGAFGEVQVMDWGLAKVLPVGGIADEKKSFQKQQGQSIIQTLRSGIGSDAPGMFGTFGSQTQMGSVMGTPAYMPPEQALGEIDNLDERADVFGLGAILCEILTGKPPYVADNGAQVFRMASRGKLGECLSRLESCGADVELIALAKQCLSPEPNDRPGDAGVLAEHVAGYLESVETKLRATELERATQAARAESETRRVEQQQRAARKLRMALGGVALVALVAGIAFVAALLANKRANDLATIANNERRTAQKEAADAEIARQLAESSRVQQQRLAEELKQRQGVSDFILARNAWEQGDLSLASERLANVPLAQRSWEWGYLKRHTRGGLFTLYGHSRPVGGVAYSADGTRIATASEDKTAKVWDANTGLLLFELRGHTHGLSSVRFSPDGKQIVTGGWDTLAKVWDAHTGKHLLDLKGHTDVVTCVACTADGTRIVTASHDNTAKVWDSVTGLPVLELPGHNQPVSSVAVSPDGARIATGSQDRTAKVWDLKSGTLLLDLGNHPQDVRCVAFSPDGKRIATGCDRVARLWDAENGQLLQEYKDHDHVVTSVAFSFDGLRLVTGSIDGSAKVWSTRGATLLVDLKGPGNVGEAVFSPDGTRIFTGNSDGTATVWDARAGTLPLESRGSHGGKGSVAYSPDGREILTIDGNIATVRDAISLTPLRQLKGHTDGIQCVSYSQDGSRILTSSFDKTMKIWDAVHDGPPLLELKGLAYEVCGAAFSPDGKLVVTCGGEWRDPNPGAEVKVWDAVSGTCLFDLTGHSDLVYNTAFSPDGAKIATAGWDGTAKVWDAKTGELLVDFREHSERVNCVAFSPDGTLVMTGSDDHTTKVWDPATGSLALNLKEQSFKVFCASFSRDGKRIITGGGEWSGEKPGVTVWDVQSGTPLVILSDFQGRVTGATFSPDGTQIATCSIEQATEQWVTRIWRSQPGNALLGELRGHKGWIVSLSFSPDGARIVSAGQDRTAKVWDVRTQKLLFSLEGHPGNVGNVIFSPDGKQIITECQLKLRGWNALTGEQLPDSAIHSAFNSESLGANWGWFKAFAPARVSPDGKIFVQANGSVIELIQVQPNDEEIAYRRFVTQTNWPALLENYMAAKLAGDDMATNAYYQLFTNCPDGLKRTAIEKAIKAGDPQFATLLLASIPTDQPDYTELLLRVAALQAWYGRDQELLETCRQRLDWARDTTTPEWAERVAKICCIRPLEDQAVRESALILARRAVDLGANSDLLNWFEMTLGMAEYRSGHFADAETVLMSAASRDPNNQNVVETSNFYRAMILFHQGQQEDARQLAATAAARMKPLPQNEKLPMVSDTSHDDLIMWMAYQEAKALIQFDAAPASSNSPVR